MGIVCVSVTGVTNYNRLGNSFLQDFGSQRLLLEALSINSRPLSASGDCQHAWWSVAGIPVTVVSACVITGCRAHLANPG